MLQKKLYEDSCNSDWMTQGCVIMAMEAKHLFNMSPVWTYSHQTKVKIVNSPPIRCNVLIKKFSHGGTIAIQFLA